MASEDRDLTLRLVHRFADHTQNRKLVMVTTSLESHTVADVTPKLRELASRHAKRADVAHDGTPD